MSVEPMVSSAPSRLLPPLILFGLTLALTLAGILARPIESLSLFWPVNAVLAGVLLRNPRQATPSGFALIYLAMVVADLGCGSAWKPALWFNLCNLGAIVSIWYLMARLPRVHRRLRTPHGTLRLFGACAVGAMVAASLACVMATPWFEQSLRATWLAWFSEQFSTSVLVLPVLLTAPSPRALSGHGSQPIRLAPLLVLLASLAVSIVFGGPGAIAFPIAALLWCALSYSPFLVALLALTAGSTLIVAVAQNLMHFSIPQSESGVTTLMSARLGIAMLVLGPLVLACVSSANRSLMARLAHQATIDHLTGTLSRSAFTRRANALLDSRQHTPQLPLTLMMLDIDHFKTINDRHGHGVGDQVLRQFAMTLQDQLHDGELFARLGGEEFVIIVPGLAPELARFTAERLRRAVQDLHIAQPEQALRITVSIGLSGCAADTPAPSLDELLASADQALYRAKAQGRNRVEQAEGQRQAR
ncbi:GGDEF domain-containing protein [Pseudomonas mosselii]|uniref:GGDEF domain-containing protein n=1 Tax=Pseudomonas mosselii TaxID=78327 RepID=UPI000781CAD0|nr:GGDEF domain-containing protein [Pseudomonas mosselii]ATB63576.1 sensor domain-containing diguanylate cyclase [Pseudomonas mosselii]MCH7420004.1 diguanylate cyclase [Pseudomonas mosselii]MDH1099904.1 diguanylate cyclase [Pseudomonas mosselii]MDH1656601.1 diguanylate cyclase [Pseudomonas mosselii]MDH1718025.1 diguanylate cyclase [Pseudomonas mosselii]